MAKKGKKGIRYWSIVISGIVGFLVPVISSLVDFGLETIDFKEPLAAGLLFSSFVWGRHIFNALDGERSFSQGLKAVLFLSLVTFVIGAAIALFVQQQAFLVLGVGIAGALVSISVFGSMGSWIEKWKKIGFQAVILRTIGFMLGLVVGVVLMIVLPMSDPEIWMGNWERTIMYAMNGLWLGSFVDWIKSRKK